jgi:hypothetical protein
MATFTFQCPNKNPDFLVPDIRRGGDKRNKTSGLSWLPEFTSIFAAARRDPLGVALPSKLNSGNLTANQGARPKAPEISTLDRHQKWRPLPTIREHAS